MIYLVVSMQNSWYHSILRVTASVLALLLLFVSGIISPYTKDVANHARLYLANAVGVTVGVEKNELNKITSALTQKESELAEREALLHQREIEVGIRDQDGYVVRDDRSTYILSAILFIVVVLIVINYTLDFTRERRLLLSAERKEQGA